MSKTKKTPKEMTDKQLIKAFEDVCDKMVAIEPAKDTLSCMKGIHDLYELHLEGMALSREIDAREAKGSKAFKGVTSFMADAEKKIKKDTAADIEGAVETLAKALGVPYEDLMKFTEDCVNGKKAQCKEGCKTCKKTKKKFPKAVQDIFEELNVDPQDIAGYTMIDLDSGEVFSEDFSKLDK